MNKVQSNTFTYTFVFQDFLFEEIICFERKVLIWSVSVQTLMGARQDITR
jgi:hypothetical protein